MTTEKILNLQRSYFDSGRTLDTTFRQKALVRLRQSILNHTDELYSALQSDLGKSQTEAYMTEIGLTLSALKYTLRHLRQWTRKKRVSTPLAQFHAKSIIYKEPHGVVLIMSPWNYPVLLTLEPLIGAIAAGNCVIIKNSPYSTLSNKVLNSIISEAFELQHVAIPEDNSGDTSFLDLKYDYIFFTGSPKTGKTVMSAAAKHLTPVTLELGGKSPCIVDSSADIEMAARRIVFGKFLNCGQTCVAPDYLIVEKSIETVLVQAIIKEIKKQYGENVSDNPDYGKIINSTHFNRLISLIDKGKIIFGGEYNSERLQIYPTLIGDVSPDDAIMQEEIFGPLLPVITYDTTEEAIAFVNSRPRPLALYLFTNNKSIEGQVVSLLHFGGGCINDTIIHLASSALPFGGTGNSGMGSYHGKFSFDTFSRNKSIVKKYCWIDLPFRYQPYTKIKDFLIRLFLR